MAAVASKVPKATLLRLGIIGGVGLYVAFKSLYNVEGGHRAIVFNRIHGIKDRVNLSRHKVYSSLSNSILLKAVSVSK
jgi:hypothetical protein